MSMDYKIQKKIESNPKLKKFFESEDNEKACRYISMAYLLHSIANEMTEEATDIMRKYGLFHFEIKHQANSLTKAFDLYNRTIAKLIVGEEGRQAFVNDYEKFFKICEEFMGLGETMRKQDNETTR